jgi:hypothetical protein
MSLSLARQRTVRASLKHNANILAWNRGSVHYTQGSLRWSWKHHDGLHLPFYGDCSSTVTCLYWLALKAYGIGDILNGLHWQAGYTGTLANHGRQVSGRPGTRRVGDLVLYGYGFPFHHVAMVIAPGMVFTHGSEAGPFIAPIDYRGDRAQVRRYI